MRETHLLAGAIPILLIPYFLVFTKFGMLSVLTLAWLAYDWNTHSQAPCFQRLWWPAVDIKAQRHNAEQGPKMDAQLVKTHDLCPKHNYIIANHPHGILSYGVFIIFATEATGFAQILPAITPYVGTLEGMFWIPIVRDYVMSMGVCPVSELALKYLLTKKGLGNAVVIVVGGAAEALLCHPGASTVLLKQRKAGEPLPIPKIKKPNKKTVDKYHALYISALCKLFDQRKVQYGLPETQELTII
ncbi:hypothetical protein J1605_003700 [Eschrichtius robustus]|uniref:Diacylglycerol O-acyltransferase 2-like protein 6 n=1 Tax=Eschrichtius robustus TaxID=9764 RepID=A0AB34HKU4_ESCRO|nr:hypothetical protein J1605_003700 [Eschrichtius robustus]